MKTQSRSKHFPEKPVSTLALDSLFRPRLTTLIAAHKMTLLFD
jgi:hypothetical protein